MMPMHVFPGYMELLMILLMGSGGGLPLGIPPAAEDPVMSHVAPEECLFYLSWAGMAAPDPNSPNQTEQLLAEPEVQRFVMELEKRIVESLKREAGRDPEAAEMIDDVHLVVKTVLTSPTAVFVSKVDLAAGMPDARAGAVVNLGDRAAEVEKSLRKLEDVAFRGGATEVKGEATTWRALPMPQEAPPVLWAVKGKYLVVGLGRGEAEAIYARARTNTPAWLADLRKQLAVERPANMMVLNVGQILKTVGPLMGQEGTNVVEALGLANVRSLASVTGLDETGCVSKTLIGTDGQLTGLLSLAAAEPLSKEDLALIPKDSTLAAAARFDLAKAYGQLLKILGRVDPRAREEFLGGMGELEEQLGMKLAKDVFESLGDVWRVYNSPSEGGLIVTGLTAVVDVKDHDRLVAANGKLVMGQLAREAARRMREGRRRRGAMISQSKHGDRTIFFLNVVGEEFPLAPAWCITDKELVVALFPQNVKAYLDRKASGGGAGSLADVPEVAAAFAEGQAPMKVVYCDTPEIFKLVYPVVQIVAQVACSQLQREGLDVDVSILPSAPVILRHLRPGVMTVRRTKGGIMIESRQTLPVGGGGALGLPAVLFMGFAVRVSEAPAPMFAPSQTRSMNNLKQIGLALLNHDAAMNGFPPAAAPMKEGQPPVSWRVRVLPYLEQQALYDQYHLDEPWDSQHNKQFVARIPEVYKAPGSKVGARGMTNYLAVAGDDFAFSATKKRQSAEIRDGLSNTIMVVEAADSKAVPWTKPEDFTPEEKNPAAGLLGLARGGFLAAICDGSVHLIPDGLDPATLYALFTIKGGEVVDWERVRRAPRRVRTKAEFPVPLEKKAERKLQEKAEEKVETAPRLERRPAPRKRRAAPPLENAP